jgi:hypothetical protein
MSNNVNTGLLERASEMIDYFESKLPAQLIEADLASNDLEALHGHVLQAEAEASCQEHNDNDIY